MPPATRHRQDGSSALCLHLLAQHRRDFTRRPGRGCALQERESVWLAEVTPAKCRKASEQVMLQGTPPSEGRREAQIVPDTFFRLHDRCESAQC